jgi:acetyl esterase/lipase
MKRSPHFAQQPWLLLLIFVGSALGVFFASARYLANRTNASPPPPPSTSTSTTSPRDLKVELSSFTPTEELTLRQSQQATSNFLGSDASPAQYPLQTYTLSFTINVEDGSQSPIKAEVFVPQTDTQSQVFPTIIYGPGTTGLDDRCAPSRESRSNPDLGNYRNQMITQSAQGFVVVMPNYEGLDNPERIHYYFNADLEARTLLGSASSLFRAAEQTPLPIKKNEVFIGGYSQGGHAAFAAADRAHLYAQNITVKGVFGHGPTTNTTALLRDNPNLAPYLVYAYKHFYPEFDEKVVLQEQWWNHLEAAKDFCVDEAFYYNSAQASRTYQPDFLAALQSQNVAEKYPKLAQLLNMNNAGENYTKIPSLILQGTKDPIVTLDSQKQFVEILCRNEVPVKLTLYENLDHFFVRQRSFTDTNQWILAIDQGQPTETSC